jgi:hypothetical protein
MPPSCARAQPSSSQEWRGYGHAASPCSGSRPTERPSADPGRPSALSPSRSATPFSGSSPTRAGCRPVTRSPRWRRCTDLCFSPLPTSDGRSPRAPGKDLAASCGNGQGRRSNCEVVVVVAGLVSLHRIEGIRPLHRLHRIRLFDCLGGILLLHRLHRIGRLRALSDVSPLSAVRAVIQGDANGHGGPRRSTLRVTAYRFRFGPAPPRSSAECCVVREAVRCWRARRALQER